MKPKFVIGDKVKVVGYGHPYMISKELFISTYKYTEESEIRIFLGDEYLIEKSDEQWAKEALDGVRVLSEENGVLIIDSSPELVDRTGIVSSRSDTQGVFTYSLKGIDGKRAWYDEDQLKMVNPNPNRE